MKLSDSDSALLEQEFEQAKKALRKARRAEFDEDGLGLYGSGPDGSVGDSD